MPHARVIPATWRDAPPVLADVTEPLLAYGCGRSYGDSCLNQGGALIDTAGLDRFISLDDEGVLRCEAGLTLAEILEVIVPRGWFLPVLPGTRWVTVGGAIANDIHGKNHHLAGTFGAHVTRFELLRSSGERLVCSPDAHGELFAATIGGLGLTGLILWAEIRLRRLPGPGIELERVRFADLNGFLALADEDSDHEYTVAWVDCLAGGRRLGRGIYLRGTHVTHPSAYGIGAGSTASVPHLRVPFDAPSLLLNRVTLTAFNALQYHRGFGDRETSIVPYQKFFFPLDAIGEWNRLYGARGFLQYQCVVPDEAGGGAVRTILSRVALSGETAALGVLKRFGSVASPGLLSFPRPGLTLAIDLAFRGRRTLDLLDDLDRVVREVGGAVYPAKDARMSAESFRSFFPRWEEFSRLVDPGFSSSFWRRVHVG